VALSATQSLLLRAALAGDHPLLHGIRSGTANANEIAAWVQSRVRLAEYHAMKEILVLAKLSDREARRRWTLRLLAIDGHGDFYGPSKQGLLESWRRLGVLVCGPTSLPPPAAFNAALDHLLHTQLCRLQNASWTESLGFTLVDDWVARNDCVLVGVLQAEKRLTVSSCREFQLVNHQLTANTLVALEAQLGVAEDQELLKQVLKSIEVRVQLEHAILEATQQSTRAH
jgi:hypothetical protein